MLVNTNLNLCGEVCSVSGAVQQVGGCLGVSDSGRCGASDAGLVIRGDSGGDSGYFFRINVKLYLYYKFYLLFSANAPKV